MTLVPLTVRSAGPVLRPTVPLASAPARHDVTATFSGSRWTLRFGAGGGAAVAAVARLTGADVVARRLVAGRLGCPPAAVRVRIVPDAEQLRVLRRTRGV